MSNFPLSPIPFAVDYRKSAYLKKKHVFWKHIKHLNQMYA